jgi:hypothetical protein
MLILYLCVLTTSLALAHSIVDCDYDALLVWASSGFVGHLEECAGGVGGAGTSDISDWATLIKQNLLIAAACGNQVDVVRWLLERGAVVSRNRYDLQCAAGLGHAEMVNILAANGIKDKQELCQPLLMAASNGHIAAIEVLMKYGADPTCTVYCYTPIELAPPRLYDGILGYLPTCTEFVNKMAEDLAGEKEKQAHEKAELRAHYPGMGLLEDLTVLDTPVYEVMLNSSECQE